MKMLKPVLCLLLLHLALADDHLSDGRIIGGEVANIFDFPYQVSIEHFHSHKCGGSIIARTWILSTAHCVIGFGPSTIRVRAGTPFREIGGQVLNISRVIAHDNYSSTTYDFNIGLLQLTSAIVLSITAQIVKLPDNGNAIIEGLMGNVTGWGATVEGGNWSSVLRVVEVPVISHSVCADLYNNTHNISDRMLCAGFWDGGRNSCQGDGGGPLVIDSVLTGLVSWAVGCARPQQPGVYTNVGVLRDWITEQTGI